MPKVNTKAFMFQLGNKVKRISFERKSFDRHRNK